MYERFGFYLGETSVVILRGKVNSKENEDPKLICDSAEQARKFADKKVGVSIPATMGKHVYNDWEPIIERRGASHPLMDPFKMEANKHFYYSTDMCTKSLEIMSRCAHVSIDPDWTQADIDQRAAELIAALAD